MKPTNIIFTCAGRRNYLVNYFKEALNGNGTIFAADSQLNAPAMVDADIAIQVPSVYADNYIETLICIINDNKIDAVISLNDLELPILSKHKDYIEANTNTKVIVSNEFVISTSFDKWKTHNFLLENGMNSPKTFINIDKAKSALDNGSLNFPLILKPRWGSGSIGIEIVKDHKELELAYELLKVKITRTILKSASMEDLDFSILIQEMIDGVEFGMDILNDFEGGYYDSFAREKIGMRSGETDKAKSSIIPELTAIGATISKALGHVGNLDCDIFVKDNVYYVLELNPRFGGGYPFSHEAGIDTASIYISWINGITEVDQYNNYKDGIAHAKCDRLIRIPS